jgi:hypothetical protein
MNRKTWVHLLALIGLLATYGLAFGLDRRVQSIREGLAVFFESPDALMWTWSLANILLALCVFSIDTWVMPRIDRWAVWSIVILGILINFIPVLYWIPFWYQSNLDTSFLSLFLSNRAYVSLVGGFTAVAGLFTLFRKKTARNLDIGNNRDL